MSKLLLILALGGALADGLTAPRPKPPLLIDAHPAPSQPAALDASS